MPTTSVILNQILPILLLIGLGWRIKQNQFLSAETINELRKIVVNLALPAVLFVSFLNLELEKSYFLIFVAVFLICVFLFFLGKGLGKLFGIQYGYFPYLTTGFEYGMLAISLFGAAYGLEKIGYIAIVDLGHEVFIWFVFLPLLLIKRDGAQKPAEILRAFISAPVVVAILASLALNLLGAGEAFARLPISGGILNTLALLSPITVPLMLIIVGYGINFNFDGIKAVLGTIALRLSITIPLALSINAMLIRGYLGFDKFFEIGLFTLLIMPPPFIIPMYTSKSLAAREERYINNVLTAHTLVSVIIFLVFVSLNPLT